MDLAIAEARVELRALDGVISPYEDTLKALSEDADKDQDERLDIYTNAPVSSTRNSGTPNSPGSSDIPWKPTGPSSGRRCSACPASGPVMASRRQITGLQLQGRTLSFRQAAPRAAGAGIRTGRVRRR
jgi:hypothetical protein